MRTASRSSNSRWTQRTNKTPVQDFSQHSCQKTCPYGQSGIRRLPGCLRYAPASNQSSSIHNSLRSIKQTAVWRLESSSPENFGDSAILPKAKISASLIEILSSRSHKTPAVYAPLIPTGKHYRLRYRSAEWTLSTPWPERFQLRWHLRMRLGNVSKLPFLSACT